MNRAFYTRLALTNIKKNSKIYIPYILTCIITITMFYIMKSLSMNPGIAELVGDQTLYTVLNMGTMIVGMFAVIFLFYTNSFLMKNRKKEFGMFHILGMEKRHLAKVIFLETLLIWAISLVAGITLGIALDKLMFLVIAKMMQVHVPLGFFISGEVIVFTSLFFGAIFLLLLLNSIRMLHVSKPAELLKGGNAGEKEPKTRWLMTLLGLIAMGAGYYIALTTKNPVSMLSLFFLAVVFVILGTYLLFTAGSIALLKFLRKRKNYYYQTSHFISVSGMIYRMKQNAVGLANICILSTMVLVMVSSTASMMVGFDDILNTRYPNGVAVYGKESHEEQNKAIQAAVRTICEERKVGIKKEDAYSYLSVLGSRNNTEYTVDVDQIHAVNDLVHNDILVFFTLEDYNKMMNEQKELQPGEVFLYASRTDYKGDSIRVFDREYKVAGVLKEFRENGDVASDIWSSYYLVLPDQKELEDILISFNQQQKDAGRPITPLQYYYGIDTKEGSDTEIQVAKEINNKLKELSFDVTVECRNEDRAGMLGIYGGLFFLGIFLGILFMVATVLIMYYKQISEGYQDRERFAIMQKVGLSQSEVKKAIGSQVLQVFFLPLVVAGIHLAVAFPMISKVLLIFNMTNTNLYILCIGCCYAIFVVVYIFIYCLTAKTYYKIVSGK